MTADKSARDRLAEWIEESGLKKKVVAARLDVQPGSLAKWVSGGYVPLAKYRAKIEAMMGIPASDWMEGK